MASIHLREQLSALIDAAGSTRKAAALIKERYGSAPTHAALNNAAKGANTSDFVVSCYIDILSDQIDHRKKRGHVVAVANQKGGVGKSTVGVNFGLSLAALGLKVLFIDIDPQNDLADALAPDLVSDPDYIKGIHPANNYNMFNWADEADPFRPVPHMRTELVHVIGTSKKVGEITQDQMYRMADSLDLIKGEYDFVILDSPPTTSMLQHTALSLSDSLLIVSELSKPSFKAVGELMSSARQVKKRMNPNLSILGIVNNGVVKTTEQSTYDALLREKYPELMFKSNISKRTKIQEAFAKGMSVIEYAPSEADACGMTDACNEFINRLVPSENNND